MGGKKVSKATEELRFTPGSLVCWFEGLESRTGRVLLNIRKGEGRIPDVVIKDAQGRRYTKPATQVFIKAIEL